MIHEGMAGTPSSPPFSGFPHHHSPYHAARRRPSPPGSPAAGPKTCCFGGRAAPGAAGGPPAYPKEPLFCCCYNCPAPTSCLASLGICCLVLGYTLMGAFTFMTLEGGLAAETSVAASKPGPTRIESLLGADIRSRTVDKLWSITEDLNILYKENWTRLAAQEVLEFQDSLVRALRLSNSNGYFARQGTMFYHQSHRWTFSSSFLYSLTLITTIGYGSVAPRTPMGKLTTILYAIIGIPLMLVYLSTMGEVLARSFRHLYARLRGVPSCSRKAATTPPHNHVSLDSKLSHYYKEGELARSGVILNCGSDVLASATACGRINKHKRYCTQVATIPVSLCISIIILYIIGGAFLFNRLENWSFLEGSYFCFTSLGTIGFGDLVPGEHTTADELSHCICSVYILVGMALIAMCFNLVQEEVAVIIRSMGRLCSSEKSTMEYNHQYSQDSEEIAMSVVS